MDPQKIIEYQAVARFAVEMHLQEGLIKEAQQIFDEHLCSFKEVNSSLRLLEAQINLSRNPESKEAKAVIKELATASNIEAMGILA